MAYKKSSKILIVICALLQIQCANVLTQFSAKDDNDALLYEAKLRIDDHEYESAITYLNQLSASYAADNDVRIVFASAYAGACGMEFIPFFNNISSADLTATSLFQYLRASFVGKEALPSRCLEAEQKLLAIGSTSTLRAAAMGGSNEVNMLMAILAMAKVGAYLRTKSDLNGTGSLGDGTTDVGFNSCTNNASNLTDDEVIEVATGFSLLMENLPALLGAGNSSSTVISGVGTAIGLYCDLVPTTKCATTDKNSIAVADKAEFVDTYRDLLKTQTVGIESCVAVDVDTCCP